MPYKLDGAHAEDLAQRARESLRWVQHFLSQLREDGFDVAIEDLDRKGMPKSEVDFQENTHLTIRGRRSFHYTEEV